ncbi:AAA family ATPase [Lacrimispora sp. 210928-DFI.3.58]|uniref:AAA family ATPase n=1 Tax=Lacrimispora sp. 210928-DFI.3.58 TaxID=2883214 RepID=UPI001D0632AD|nr:AAA family ATPase [Lacrimispora sp. 210928-DFI.3.58]MCB7319568.1 ATP-binding protein [Lacrimispora sp. 210928-DFI.3.58]
MTQSGKKIRLDNIGIIKDSTIELKGLTVVTGHNNSGKTTVGKTLFAILSAVEDLQQKALKDKVDFARSKENEIRDMLGMNRLFHFESMSPMIRIGKAGTDIGTKEGQYLGDYLSGNGRSDFGDFADLAAYVRQLRESAMNISDEALKDILSEWGNGKRMTKRSLDSKRNQLVKSLDNLFESLCSDPELTQYANKRIIRSLQKEFNGQILPVRYPDVKGTIEFYSDDTKCFLIHVLKNELADNAKTYFSDAYRDVIFIDDVFALDKLGEAGRNYMDVYRFLNNRQERQWSERFESQGHNQILVEKLKNRSDNLFEEMINQNKAEKLLRKMDEVFPDKIILSDDQYICSQSKLDVRNLAAGSKLFAIIKKLLENGELTADTLLILDEPESHLHPAWQNRFAEIIVLLVKYLEMHVLLTTHSPNFLMALDVYAKEYEIWDGTTMYCTEQSENAYMVRYSNVKNDLKTAYNKLATPLFELQSRKLRNSDD